MGAAHCAMGLIKEEGFGVRMGRIKKTTFQSHSCFLIFPLVDVIDTLGSDDATTCHIVVLRHSGKFSQICLLYVFSHGMDSIE